eukprot:TRINITY_DN5734_c0_g1_i1.p1 TRINITY_DN5734_c0_g1~~TRINITY_DN5734_c0_g1_i1.p1  ORF type:complete len:181 (-),score=51.27 TRINITY_DN5734_c0_g1_i1:6-548(-)
MNILDLPAQLISKILKHLDGKSIFIFLYLTTKDSRWQEISIEHIDFSDTDVPDRVLKQITAGHVILKYTSVRLANCPKITYKGLRALSEDLTSLDLSGCQVNTHLIKSFSYLPNLRSINLSNCSKLTDEFVGIIKASLPLLKQINLYNCIRLSPKLIQELSSDPTALQVDLYNLWVLPLQ